MKKMSEVFELPLIADSDNDINIGNGDWILINPSAPECVGAHVAHAINHVDALAEALEDLMEWHVKNVHVVHHPTFDSASKALKAYRGENNLET